MFFFNVKLVLLELVDRLEVTQSYCKKEANILDAAPQNLHTPALL